MVTMQIEAGICLWRMHGIITLCLLLIIGASGICNAAAPPRVLLRGASGKVFDPDSAAPGKISVETDDPAAKNTTITLYYDDTGWYDDWETSGICASGNGPSLSFSFVPLRKDDFWAVVSDGINSTISNHVIEESEVPGSQYYFWYKDGLPPIVELQEPMAGTVVPRGKTVKMGILAVDPNGGTITTDFEPKDGIIMTDNISYCIWSPSGDCALTANVSNGLYTTTTSVNILTTHPPNVIITSLHSGDFYNLHNAQTAAPIIVMITAVPDCLSTIKQVELLDNGRSICNASPVSGQPNTYTATWQNPEIGSHYLIARAMDDNGGQGCSNEIRVGIGSQFCKANNPAKCLGAEPVNLATGEEEHTGYPDIRVKNPCGPGVSFVRDFYTARVKDGYYSPGLSPGWVHEYDYTLTSLSDGNGNPYYLFTYPDGRLESWVPELLTNANQATWGLFDPSVKDMHITISAQSTPLFTGTFLAPLGSDYKVQGVQMAGGAFSSITMCRGDGSKWQFTPNATGVYVLSRITNSLGQSIDLHWDDTRRLCSITDAHSNAALLTMNYGADGYLSTVDDAHGREVSYQFNVPAGLTMPCLSTVSQVSPTGTQNAPMRCGYGYVKYKNLPLIASITNPSQTDLTTITNPTAVGPNPPLVAGVGASTFTIYYTSDGKVDHQVDANGNAIYLEYHDGYTHCITKDKQSNIVAVLDQQFDSQGRNTGIIDANGHSSSICYADSQNPYKPTTITGLDGMATVYYYDCFGNVTSVTKNVTSATK